MIERVISGGQSGVDRAALDFAIERGLPHGGYVPKGRLAEDGRIPMKYKVTEHPAPTYPPRTQANVLKADATVIFVNGPLNEEPGALLTANMCREFKKDFIVISLKDTDEERAVMDLKDLIEITKAKILNVAGTRGSRHPDVAKMKRILAGALAS